MKKKNLVLEVSYRRMTNDATSEFRSKTDLNILTNNLCKRKCSSLTCPEWVSKYLKSNLRIVDFPANKHMYHDNGLKLRKFRNV